MNISKMILTGLAFVFGIGAVTAYTNIETVKDGCPADTLCLRFVEPAEPVVVSQ